MRLRFTVRWMMVVVAIVVIILSVWARQYLLARQLRYRALADRYVKQEKLARWMEEVDLWTWGAHEADDFSWFPGTYVGNRDDYSMMKSKYQRLARHPWLRETPDPPEPQWVFPPAK